jgi:uncharacterized protein
MDAGEELFSAKYVLEYTYERSAGPVIGRFLGALKDRRIEGVRTSAGRVIVPPLEYDPETGEPATDFVEVGQSGVVTTHAWIEKPRPNQPLTQPFAWALVRLDGADSAFLHVVAAERREQVRTGMRVRVEWSDARVGSVRDIACFVPEADR